MKTVILLLIVILFPGCHSYYTIGLDELQDLRSGGTINIDMKNGKDFKIKKIIKANVIENNQEIEFISFNPSPYSGDYKSIFVPINNVKRISIEKIDPQKSILAPIFITMGIIGGIFLICPNCFSPGG